MLTNKQIILLLDWFGQNARALPWRTAATPYHVWLSEILLQQTRIAAVLPAYHRFLETYPTVESLAHGDDATLMKLWEGMGYYSRARNLKKCAQIVAARGAFPRNAEELQKLPGIGPYTAGAIAAIAFNEPAVAVDGNVTRVLSRLLGRTIPREEAASLLQPQLPQGRAGAFSQAWMELGEVVCLPHGTPHCNICPLANDCLARRTNRIAELPARTARTARPVIPLTVFHLHSSDGCVALRQRPSTGLLAGLWEYPNTPGHLTSDQAREWLGALGFTILQFTAEAPTRHLFTHREWQMTNYSATVTPMLNAFTWATPIDLSTRYALPSAFKHTQRTECQTSGESLTSVPPDEA